MAAMSIALTPRFVRVQTLGSVVSSDDGVTTGVVLVS